MEGIMKGTLPEAACLILYADGDGETWLHAEYVDDDELPTDEYGRDRPRAPYYRSKWSGESLDPYNFIACAPLPEAQ
jgi:hypothetical protein